MKTDPDLTWEWLDNYCDKFIDYIHKLLELNSSPEIAERLTKQLETNEKLRTVLPKLREHPQLKDYVPMKAMMWLRWFPAAHREIHLDVEGDTNDFLITVITVKEVLNWETNEEKLVALDDVADEIYAYITKLRDD